MMTTIRTPLTELLGIRYPLIAGPMFLVSNVELVVAVSEAGGLGAFPALNFRPVERFRAAVREVKDRTDKPFAVNLIVNKSNIYQAAHLAICVEEQVPCYITSLGNPGEVIVAAHGYGAKVFCDVTTQRYAEKVKAQGADGLIAVGSGAGGHAGPTSPLVLIPWLAKLGLPVIAAGGVATGAGLAACLALGAAGVQMGTRFIASTECAVTDEYKQAIVDAQPDDIVLTTRISGTPAAVIRTPYIEKVGLELNWLERMLAGNPWTKRLFKLALALASNRTMEAAATRTTWKQVWSAGQSVGLVDEILPAAAIVRRVVDEYQTAVASLPAVEEAERTTSLRQPGTR
jgi:nitronate monooxygenase